MQCEIKNRWTGKVQFTAEIEADESAAVSLKIGLAVKWAVKTDADLGGADLRGANFEGANCEGANLGGANLGGANLGGANLGGANFEGTDLRGAYLEDQSKLTGERPVLTIGPLGSRCDYLTIYRTDKGLRVKAGCFFGSDTDFEKAVAETHGTSKHATDYAAAIAFARIALKEEP